MQLSERADVVGSPAEDKPSGVSTAPERELFLALTRDRRSLTDITWQQQVLHERRRWSVSELIGNIDLARLSDADRAHVWNAGKAELTTKPGADRVARLFDNECRRHLESNPTVANIMQACGTWSRYWNEEEAHHETAFNRLALLLGLDPISDETFIEYRKIFPDDDALRTLMLLAISEITAAVNYGQCARHASDPGLKALFKQVGADEIQHMNYFISFAKALVDSGAYPPKNALAVAVFFLREGGDLEGAHRTKIEQRGTHVNWWDHIEFGAIGALDALEKKEALVFHAVERVTGVSVSSLTELEDAWMDMLS
jgi:hypothetical protein